VTRDEKDWLRLHLTRGLGRTGIIRLMEAFGSLREVLDAPPAAWTKRAGIRETVAGDLPAERSPRLEAACRELEKARVRIVSLWDQERYPRLLRAIHDPPALLYVRGELPTQEALAVVGARRASTAARRLTTEICAELACRDITVISGLARGIDSAAHQGALDGGGCTVAVLGCGIDRIYPPENARLFQRIVERGAVISEYQPGTPPLAGHFPGRNRIISGLCRGVLVVEAAEESGSLITVDFALEQGREVFAVPGPVYAPTSRGVNRLLKDGAHVVTEAQDILDALWPQVPRREVRQQEDSFAAALAEDAHTLYRQLGDDPLHIDELVQKSGLTPMEVSAILLHLELQGGVQQLPGMRYIRRCRP
jgi:DNA processing protein